MSIRADYKDVTTLNGNLAALDGLDGEWGFLSSKTKYPDGVPVAKVAAIMEADDGFFTRAVEMVMQGELGEEYEKEVEKLYLKDFDPENVVKSLVQILAKALVKVIDADNKIDTGLMRRTVRWRVKDKGQRAKSGRGDKQL